MTIAVVGGGILGAATALALSRHVPTVQWYAPDEPGHRAAQGLPDADARAYTLAPRSVALLQDLGVWPLLADEASPVRAMVISAQASLRLDAQDAETPLAELVRHEPLRLALEQAVALSPKIQRLPAWQPNGRMGESALPEAELVVAADGARSPLRRAAGLLWAQRDYGQTALVAAFLCDQPHGGQARQWFLPGAVLALLPLAHPQQVSMVYSLTDAAAARFEALDPQARAAALSQICGEPLMPLLQADGQHRLSAAPLQMGFAERYAQGRLVLVGDAAHTVHPLAGYGLNLGLDDLRALLALVQDPALSRLPWSLRRPKLVARYHQARSRAAALVQWGIDGLHRWFVQGQSLSGVQGLGASITAMGMRAVQGLPRVQKALVTLAQTGRLIP